MNPAPRPAASDARRRGRPLRAAVSRSARAMLLACAMLTCSGCLVLTTQPFYDAASLEFDEALIGRWEQIDDKTLITVERGEWKSYKVTYPARSGPVVYAGHLTRVGDIRVFDLTPAHSVEPASLLIPAHFAVRLQLLGDTLTVTGLDHDWFSKEAEEGRLARLRPILDNRRNVVLTAETAGLRGWMAAQARGGEMFSDEFRFVRKP